VVYWSSRSAIKTERKLEQTGLAGWVAATADLLKPLYDLMCDRVRSSHVIHTDYTGIKMLPLSSGVLELPLRSDIPSGSSNKPASPAGRMPVTKTIRTRSMNSA
jgi:hypothetical protein